MEHQDLTGQVLDGRYRVIAPIGKGAMGSVYRAEHLKLGRAVAIKVMNEHVPNEMASRRRFDREAAAMAKLEHPHCASVLDVGMQGDQPFVVMEFVSGRSLDELVDEGPVPIPRAVEIARQILSGLAHAHEHGIIHRDIKPSNIVLSQKSGVGDHVKVLDFGLAKLSQETSNITIGVIVGTPSYMAPEQIRGLALDQRVDVYACGVLLFELLTGRKPFRAASNDPLAICMAHLNDPTPRLADALPGRDFGGLEDVIAHALAKDRDRRFMTAGAFANALAAAVPAQSAPPVQAAAPAQAAAPVQAAAPAPPVAHAAIATGATMPLAEADLEKARSGSLKLDSLPPVTPHGATMSLAELDLEKARSGSLKLDSLPPVTSHGATMSLAEMELIQARASSTKLTPLPSSEAEPSAPSASIAARPPKPARSKRGLAIGGAAVALAGGIALVAVTRGGGSTPAPAPPAAPAAGGDASAEPPSPAPPPAQAETDPVADLVAQAGELVADRRRDAAISLLVKARPTYPRDARLPYHAGLLYMEKMFRSDGLKQLRAAIELDPSYRTDPKLIDAVVRAFNTTAQYDWALASFLRNDIGDAAKPALEDVAKNHRNPIVRARATAELRRY